MASPVHSIAQRRLQPAIWYSVGSSLRACCEGIRLQSGESLSVGANNGVEDDGSSMTRIADLYSARIHQALVSLDLTLFKVAKIVHWSDVKICLLKVTVKMLSQALKGEWFRDVLWTVICDAARTAGFLHEQDGKFSIRIRLSKVSGNVSSVDADSGTSCIGKDMQIVEK